ncbi:MAG: deoxyribose-phosphate aldolase [Bacteroidales bacterium]|nr:deoxyribose-phosphate aldolase [Candidatus Cacconaster scatequi]
MIDLTSLTVSDTPSGIAAMVGKVNEFRSRFPEYPVPASICVYPNFAATVASLRADKTLHVTVVGGTFPASQSFIEVKTLECTMAVRSGADEVDIVLPLNSFLDGRAEEAGKEIMEMGLAVRAERKDVILKVILETGVLASDSLIRDASFLAMESGADFIKTSTGKTPVSATPCAAETMCGCIAEYFRKSGRKVGFKAAGGISKAEDALVYYDIVSDILGDEWLDKRLFRFGASRLANNILSELEGSEVKYY